MDLCDVALGFRHQEFRWNSCIVRVRARGALKSFLTNAERTEEHEIYVRFHIPLDFHTLKRTLEAAWNSPEPIKIKSGREELGTGILDSPNAVREAAGRGHLSAYYDRDYDQLRAEYLARVRDAENDPQEEDEEAEQEEDEEAEQEEEDEESEPDVDEVLQVHRFEPIITDHTVGVYVVTGVYPRENGFVYQRENGFVIQDENLDMNPPDYHEDYEGFRNWVASIPQTRGINRLVRRLGEDPQRGINISHFIMRWTLSRDGPSVTLIERP